MADRRKLAVFQREEAAKTLNKALVEAGDKGISKKEALNIICKSIGIEPCPKADLGKVLFLARVRRVGDIYYLMNKGPVKTEKVVKSVSNSPKSSSKSLTFEGCFEVTIKGDQLDITARNVGKVEITILP